MLTGFALLMMRACGSDDPQDQASDDEAVPRQAIVVQIPASQWPQAQQQARQALPQQQQKQQQRYEFVPQQQGYSYMPQAQSVPPPAPPPDTGNPWAMQPQPQSYGSRQQSQPWGDGQTVWGGPQLNRPQYAQPPGQSQFRPLEEPATAVTPQPQVAAPAPVYRPSAPYDRRTGSSFGPPVYPYGYSGGAPGYYGAPGVYSAPGGIAPGWPSGYPGTAYPGLW